MRKRPLAVRGIRRGLRVFEPLVSRLELRASGVQLRDGPSHAERVVLLPVARALSVPGTVAYDIGAATGACTLAYARVATVAQVFAFEPLSDSYAELERRTRDHSNVRCFQVALGAEREQRDLNRSAWRDTSSFLPVGSVTRAEFPLAVNIEGTESVRVTPLDDLVAEEGLPHPDFVKIDVQGFEDQVISGAGKTLSAARTVVVEVSFRPLYEGAPLFDDVYLLMRDLGFRLGGVSGLLAGVEGEPLQADATFERAAGGVSLSGA